MVTDKHSERYKIGLKRLTEMGHSSSICTDLEKIMPDLSRYIYEFAFGDIHSRPLLTKKEREIAIIASLTTLGHAQVELKSHIQMALNIGCTREEILETITQVVVYAGFPAAINGIYVAQDVFKQRDMKNNTYQ